jgi:hypothetical protein
MKTTTTPSDDLKARISELKILQANEGALLKGQIMITYESLKPVNLIRRTFSELTSTPGFKGNLLDTALSLGAGHLSKSVLVGATNNPFKQLFGTFLQMAVTGMVSKNAGNVRAGITQVIDFLFNKKDSADQ